MRVMDMNKCGSASLKPTALAFNPLVSSILMKRTAKRVAAAERKQGWPVKQRTTPDE